MLMIRGRIALMLAIGTTFMVLCAGQVAGAKIDYARDVRPVLTEKCYVCHGPAQQQGGLRLDSKPQRLSAAGGTKSELVRRIVSQDQTVRMPPWPTSLG